MTSELFETADTQQQSELNDMSQMQRTIEELQSKLAQLKMENDSLKVDLVAEKGKLEILIENQLAKDLTIDAHLETMDHIRQLIRGELDV